MSLRNQTFGFSFLWADTICCRFLIFTPKNRNLCVTNCDALSSILNVNIVTMKRVAIFITFMLNGFTSCDKLRDDSHFYVLADELS